MEIGFKVISLLTIARFTETKLIRMCKNVHLLTSNITQNSGSHDHKGLEISKSPLLAPFGERANMYSIHLTDFHLRVSR